MTTLSASSSRPADTSFAVAATLVAVVVFLVGWGVLHRGFFTHDAIVDTPVYERYGSAIDSGRVPYRDFVLEYPPGALPVFALPALGGAHGDVFRRRFELLMAFLGEVMVICVAVALVALGAGRRWLLAALGFVALAPVALGPAAVAAKLYPVVLVPLTIGYVWKREGRREALVCGGLLLAVLVAVFIPFVVLAPHGVWESVWSQGSRPLQIESLGAAFLLNGHHVFGYALTMDSSHGSQNLAGAGADAFAVALSVLQLAALVATWILFARGPATRERLLLASAAALVAFVALGKVLSPQFLIWLIAVVPLVSGRRGLIASMLLAATLVVTQLWFPYRYWDLALHFGALETWLVLVRDLLLVALFALLASGLVDRDPESLTVHSAA
ncbi:MAG: hypothetical protein E6G31_05345 [Actinobacteria bacterium]|nr:MAG: hypothetical protein E6G31_05345 [Actinomycetota bacterium]